MHKSWRKVTSWVDRKPSNVSISKRLLAYIIDWCLGGIISGFPAILIYSAVTKKGDMFSNLYVFASLGYSNGWAYLAGGLCFIAALIYYVYIPYKKYHGQTIGKHLVKIKIVKNGLFRSRFKNPFNKTNCRDHGDRGSCNCYNKLFNTATYSCDRFLF
ncbi:hypothetical protein DFM90_002703 [Clostridium beijerinckii]|uniref:RDD family protein n=1 Tax=Clostridium beijerinckii TaxID=1520 RepID=UPI001F4C37F9|nr:RDD family protein [Clostridium beijerinckii]NRX21666.1 hypothetical protein [Clostridium beijerinckii]